MKNNYCLILCCLFGWLSGAQTINFPDPALKQIFLDGYTTDINGSPIMIDINNDNEIQQSEALLVYGLSWDYAITNADGLQYFTNVNNFYLDGGNTGLTSLDLSAMTHLQYLFCRFTSLHTISFSGGSLIGLSLTDNNLSTIDLSSLSGSATIVAIDLSHNSLTSIDLAPLTACPELGFIKLSNNQLTALDWSPMTNNENIAEIIARNNQIAAFDFAQVNEAVKSIEFQNNQLTQVDFSQLGHNLTALHVEDNPYGYFDTAGLAHIDTLSAGSELLHDAKFTAYNFESVNLFGHHINAIDFRNGINESCFSIFHLCFFGPRFGTFRNPSQIICVDDFPYFADESGIIFDKSERNYWNLMINGEDDQAQDPLTGPHITTYCSDEPGGGFNTIAGNVKYDCGNGNQNLFQVPVHIVEGGMDSASATNISGNYRLYTVQNAVTVAPDLEYPAYFTVTPANYTYDFSSTGNTETANFCINPNGIHHNLEISMYPITSASPGFDAKYLIVYKNNGNQNASGTVTFNFDDAIMDFVSANPAVNAQNPNTLSWDFTNLAPFESRNALVVLNLNTAAETPPVNSNDELSFSAQAAMAETDEAPADNQAHLRQTVIASFDPNDKQVAEGNQVNIDNAGDYLHYIIRFQNTGTAAAQNIVIEDYLESNLDPGTLQVVSASHPYRTTLTDGNQFEVFFEGINLPASTDNESASQGYVAFKVKPKSGITLGTTIKNKANIHFDFNFPVVTHETSTLFTLLARKDFTAANHISVYPNPAQNVLHIKNDNFETIQSVQIYNLPGQLIYSNDRDLQRQFSIDVSAFETGHYFMRIATQSSVSMQRFVKK